MSPVCQRINLLEAAKKIGLLDSNRSKIRIGKFIQCTDIAETVLNRQFLQPDILGVLPWTPWRAVALAGASWSASSRGHLSEP